MYSSCDENSSGQGSTCASLVANSRLGACPGMVQLSHVVDLFLAFYFNYCMYLCACACVTYMNGRSILSLHFVGHRNWVGSK